MKDYITVAVLLVRKIIHLNNVISFFRNCVSYYEIKKCQNVKHKRY